VAKAEVLGGDFKVEGNMATLSDGKYEVLIYHYDNKEFGIHEKRVRAVNLDPTLKKLFEDYGG
jgi:hypothetical protein